MKGVIYIRMPRCGSTSIGDGFCRENNIKYFGGRDMGFWAHDKLVKKNTSSKLYECVSNYVGKEIYDTSFTFTSVRNPYSRAVSMYKHVSWSSAKTFGDFCNRIIKNDYPSKKAKWHSSTLTEHIVDGDDLKVDFVIRIENSQEDLDIVCNKIGIPQQEIPHRNKSRHKHYTEYYDDETREIVSEKYAKDIEYFGYEF
tara:strand:- start:3047 stop:3640 length:594 start_codon:yes stop_codon:yes gene_type:complete